MNDILKNLTVLFVEDEEKIRTSMASVMEDVFKKVIVAGNGDEGLKKFKKYNPDLVITDITMPIMDGEEAYVQMPKEIKNPVNIPITMEKEYLTDDTPVKCTIDGTGLTSGRWNGELMFEITLE